MKQDPYTEVICTGFCKYYKPGREKPGCGAYDFLRRNLTAEELRRAVKQGRGSAHRHGGSGAAVKSMACRRCGLLNGGCDFTEGLSSIPCGGHLIIEQMMERHF